MKSQTLILGLIGIAGLAAQAIPPSITDIVDGGAFLPSIAQGGWITIRGTGLASTTRTWGAADFLGDMLPTSLEGTRVSINEKPAAVYFISPSQLNVLAPLDDSLGPVKVTVSTPAGTASKTVQLQSIAPSFFMLDPQGRRYVAAVNLDGSIVGPTGLYASSPNLTKPLAIGGRALIYGTGWGLTDPRQPDGVNFSGAYPLPAASRVQITIGGAPAVVEFAGEVTPGLYQFNVIAPSLPTGDHQIVGSLGGAQTQSGAFITILGTTPLPQISASPTSLTFQATQGGGSPTQQVLAVSSNGTPIFFTATPADAWVTIDQISATTPATIKIAANIAGLPPGDYSSSVQINAPASSNTPVAVKVALHIAATNAPVITSVSPAGLQQGDFSSTFAILGTGLAGARAVFPPGDDLTFTVDGANSGPGSIRGMLIVNPDAVPGPKSITVINSFGSTSAIFSIQPRSGTFTISNLRAGPAVISGTRYSIPIVVDFNDSSGAATSGGLRQAVIATFSTGGLISVTQYGSAPTPSGVTAGQTRGTEALSIDLSTSFGTPSRTGTVSIVLINNRGDASNRLTGTF